MTEVVERMVKATETPESVSFGDFSFHFPSGFLYRAGQTVFLQHRATKVLRYMLERPKEVVSRQSLIDDVWESAHISDASVTEAIKQLRKTLGDDPTDPTYIQTIQRRGYRFIAPIQVDAPLDLGAPATAALPGTRPTLLWDPRLWMLTTLLLALVVLALLLAG